MRQHYPTEQALPWGFTLLEKKSIHRTFFKPKCIWVFDQIQITNVQRQTTYYIFMIVYGDPQFKATTSDFLRHLQRQLAIANNALDLDELRALLIQTGQFEQALADFFSGKNVYQPACVQAVTDLAAVAFHAALAGCVPELPAPRIGIRIALEMLSEKLLLLHEFEEVMLSIKIPEGFEFYSLYPEQYCFAALQWLAQNPSASQDNLAMVIGIRSIGTTLSALVASTLEAAGWPSGVLPSGQPGIHSSAKLILLNKV